MSGQSSSGITTPRQEGRAPYHVARRVVGQQVVGVVDAPCASGGLESIATRSVFGSR